MAVKKKTKKETLNNKTENNNSEKNYWKCPTTFNKYSKEKWNELIPIFIEEGLLKRADRTALVELCKNFGEAEEIYTHIIEDNGNIYTYLKGKNSQTSPEWAAYIKFTQNYTKLLYEFGMTPSARKRVDKSEEKTTDPMSEFLN